MKKKAIISWILVILCVIMIFIFSCMNTSNSNNKSKFAISRVVEKSFKITNSLGITNKHLSEDEINQLTEKLNYPLRKVAHASEYLILAILIIFALNKSRIPEKRVFIIAIIACFLYACSDEFHQTFVDGRTGQFSDVLIDTLGGVLGCIIIMIKNKIFKNKKLKS